MLIPGLDGVRQTEMTPGERVTGTDCDAFLPFPADSPAVRAATHAETDELPAVPEITDVAPVAVPNRIRSRAWITGSVDDLCGAEPVEP